MEIVVKKTKQCSKCSIERYITDFHLRKISLDGHRGVCRWCERKRRGGRQKYFYRKRQETDLVKAQARQKLKAAVYKNKVLKPLNCDLCQTPREKRFLAGHHVDYTKPLTVIWLCQSCHSLAHMALF